MNAEIKGGTIFDISLPTWRLGETLLHSASMAGQFGADQARVVLVAEWVGLTDRCLAAFSNRRKSLHDIYTAKQDTFRTELEVQADQINDGLAESVHRTLHPLYEIFGFFDLPRELVSSELAEMTGRHT